MAESPFAPKVNSSFTNEQAERALLMQVDALLNELARLDEKLKDVSPQLWWIVNKKLVVLERNADDVKKGIHFYFHDGEMYG